MTAPLAQFARNIMGTSVVTVRPKAGTMWARTSAWQVPMRPDFCLPGGGGIRAGWGASS